jgi:hypothetical protein
VSINTLGTTTAVVIDTMLYMLGRVNSSTVLLSLTLPSDPCQLIKNDLSACASAAGCSACVTASRTYCYTAGGPVPDR